jgi:hypothetical protein
MLSNGDSFPHLIQKRRSQLGFVTYLLNYLRIYSCKVGNTNSIFWEGQYKLDNSIYSLGTVQPKRCHFSQFIYFYNALHVSGGNSTHHQELGLYIQLLVFVKLCC